MSAADVEMKQPELEGRWQDIETLLNRTGPMVAEGFEPDTKDASPGMDFLRTKKILVIGAGGLGCELLKDLALMGFRNIEVIDMDTIDLSNLNRQFLFRKKDVGKPKAEVAAEFVNKRVSGANVVPHFKKIQDFDNEYYKQFALVVAGLDSIIARRWLNAMLHELLEYDDDGEIDFETSTIIPMIDGGTEGFKGQARVILPGITSCFECSLSLFPPQKTFPLCTLAEIPRIPQHCIEWASIIHWSAIKPFKNPDGSTAKIDTDSPDHMKWLYERALERAEAHNIEGVTYKLTQGVVKNIIPAVASTNAVVAGACANEAFKIATSCAPNLNTYMAYNGVTGVYTYTFEYEKSDTCAVCGDRPVIINTRASMKLEGFIEDLADHPHCQFKSPSIRVNGTNVFMQKPQFLRDATKHNLEKTLGELFQDGDELNVTDPSLFQTAARLVLRFA